MQDTAREGFETFKVRHVWRRKVPCRNHNIVKLFDFLLVGFMVHHRDGEFLRIIIESHPAYWAFKANIFLNVLFVDTAHDVVF